MKQKTPISVLIIGWLIIISNVVYLNPLLMFFSCLEPICDAFIRLRLVMISLVFNIIPIGLLNLFPPPNLTVTFLISIFFLFIGICILRFTNLARNIVLVMSSIVVFEQAFKVIRYGCNGGQFFALIIIALSIIVHSLYIYFLSRQKIEERFKQKKKDEIHASKGILVFGVIFLVFSLILIYGVMHMSMYNNAHKALSIYLFNRICFTFLSFAITIGLFRLKEWARKLALALGSYCLLFAIYGAIKNSHTIKIKNIMPLSSNITITVVFIIVIISLIFLLWWFFTRPKVKEQFKMGRGRIENDLPPKKWTLLIRG